jgi:hypothetical protein
MEILAVRTARVLAFLNPEELNPQGRALVPDYIQGFIQRYGFVKFPQKPDEIIDAEDKGVAFEVGRWNDFAITRLVLFSWGVVIDTESSTDVTELVLKDMLDWGAENFGLSNSPDLITRMGYLSEIIFKSDMSLPSINPKVQALGKRVTDGINKSFHQTLPYEISGITLHYDQRISRQFFAQVRIERFGDAPFSDNKYYSGAPMRTAEHVQLLEEFESALKS